jgi:hypothetical protein
MPREAETEKKSGKAAAIEVLRRSRKPLPIMDVVRAALADPAVTGLKGKTPQQTILAALYIEARKPDGEVELVARGLMKARPERR